MILTCPACATSYVVKDGAIPTKGRQVRCASCKHSWFQNSDVPATPDVGVVETGEAIKPHAAEAPALDDAAPEDHVPRVTLADVPDAVSRPTVQEEPSSGPDISDAPDQPAGATAEGAFADWDEGVYSAGEAESRRKGPLILLGLVLLVAALAAAAWFLAPREWMARAGLAEAAGDSPLKLMVTSQDRQKLASGNDLVSLSGRVINPTDVSQSVPPLQADLRDGGGKLVYSWTIAPPALRLPPRGSASFNAAELGVPANATSLTLRWAS